MERYESMFREMRRNRQQLSREACLELLKKLPRGVLSVLGDQGYPYGMPMDFWYNEEDGRLYFHSALQGHRMDALAKDGKVSFCCFDQGRREEGDWALYIQSVIVFGRMEKVEEPRRKALALRQLGWKYNPDEAWVRQTLEGHAHRAVVLALTPEHITGKLVHES